MAGVGSPQGLKKESAKIWGIMLPHAALGRGRVRPRRHGTSGAPRSVGGAPRAQTTPGACTVRQSCQPMCQPGPQGLANRHARAGKRSAHRRTDRASGSLRAPIPELHLERVPGRGCAPASAHSAAAWKALAWSGCPVKACSTSVNRHGLVETPPTATRVWRIVSPSVSSATAADTDANAKEGRSRSLKECERLA
jgi:hypothetical protein